MATPQDRGYHPRAKKGKPLPKAPLRRRREATCGWRLVVTGPDFIGCTTLLRGLERVGHRVSLLTRKPRVEDRPTWCQDYFDRLVHAWQQLPTGGAAILVEDSPWAYLTKHAVSLTPAQRGDCHAQLAPLTLPSLTLTMTTSGRSVGYRHPTMRGDPDAYAPTALGQM